MKKISWKKVFHLFLIQFQALNKLIHSHKILIIVKVQIKIKETQ
jgi:hypothetical protein